MGGLRLLLQQDVSSSRAETTSSANSRLKFLRMYMVKIQLLTMKAEHRAHLDLLDLGGVNSFDDELGNAVTFVDCSTNNQQSGTHHRHFKDAGQTLEIGVR